MGILCIALKQHKICELEYFFLSSWNIFSFAWNVKNKVIYILCFINVNSFLNT